MKNEIYIFINHYEIVNLPNIGKKIKNVNNNLKPSFTAFVVFMQ